VDPDSADPGRIPKKKKLAKKKEERIKKGDVLQCYSFSF